jgi:hypothetical protein
MGLDTSHNCWSGSYSGFGNWRETVASIVGINLPGMVGFGGSIKWDSLEFRPVYVLLDHSDCDGEIATEHLIPLADDLDRIAEVLAEGECGTSGWKYRATVRFAAGCRDAAAAGEPVNFH